jgi:serine/threonine protein kinase
MAMKVPRMTAGDGAENIVSFEVELQILPTLTGPHVPRFVAAGDMDRLPYLVMEYVHGPTLDHWLDAARAPIARHHRPPGRRHGPGRAQPAPAERVHLDLKPGNVLFRSDDHAVLLDFGLSCHAHYPDLLAEELRKAVGSPAWIAPEQVVGVRGDPRSDIFAIGVMLYELATGELPFGAPTTQGGCANACGWTRPAAQAPARRPRAPGCRRSSCAAWSPRRPALPVGRAPGLRPEPPGAGADGRRGQRTQRHPLGTHFKRWFKAAGMHYQPSPLPSQTRSAKCPSSWWPCRTWT